MEPDFWLDRWASQQIGFHEAVDHPMLVRHWSRLECPTGARVFVPLCGKSLDMVWLAEQGYRVCGVELSAIAVNAFFAERELEAAVTGVPGGRLLQAGPFALYEKDFFDLDAASLVPLDAIYDRAALIALPPELRARYAAHLTELAAPGTPMLLITVDYDQNTVNPPPFVVTDDEVGQLFADGWSIERIDHATADVKGHPGHETVFQLNRR